MSICVHTLIRNEENFIWFAVSSIVQSVDKIMLWDMQSTDKTSDVCKLLVEKYPDKISYKNIKYNGPSTVTEARQQMLTQTSEDWIWILDGDEVWWKGGASITSNMISDESLDFIVNRYFMLVGDMYHCLPEHTSKYNINSISGYINVRLMKRKSLEKVVNNYPNESYLMKNGNPIQSSKNYKVVNDKLYLHLSHLLRSNSSEEIYGRRTKQKVSHGISLASDFYYPEVFFEPYPEIINSPWKTQSAQNLVLGRVYDSLRTVKDKNRG